MTATTKPTVFAFDTETTGLEAGYNEIISLSGILYDNKFKEIDRLTVYAHPDFEERMHPKALEVNGYTAESWAERGAMNQKQMAVYINEWLIKRYCYRLLPLGHNVKFDMAHLEALYERFSMRDAWDKLFSYHCIDTVGIAIFFDLANYRELGQKYRLTDVCARFGIALDNAHDAAADIEATAKLFLKLVDLVGGDAAKLAAASPAAHKKSRMLVKKDDEWFLNAGKHKNDTLENVAEEAPDYLQWMLRSVDELSTEQRDAIETAIRSAHS